MDAWYTHVDDIVVEVHSLKISPLISPRVPKMLLDIPVSLVCHVSLWPAAHFPAEKVHKLS
jgi:hypothetical protein